MAKDALVTATLKKSARVLFDRLRPRRLSAEPSPPAPTTQPVTILDCYCTGAPDPQTALDIFPGEWSSRLPTGFARYRAGTNPLFEDPRLTWGLPQLGGVSGQSVLELGPLEGGHTWMLERAGAASVTAIEGNTRAYLKCLVIKEVLGLTRARFLCGDFVEYLRNSPPRYGFALASGVLYHMKDPVELLELLCRVTDRLLIWTHYYDEQVIRASPEVAARFHGRTLDVKHQGFRCTVYRREYGSGLDTPGFCGGSAPFSHWMLRDDILGCLRHFGLDDQAVHMDNPNSPHGPSFVVAARRSKPA